MFNVVNNENIDYFKDIMHTFIDEADPDLTLSIFNSLLNIKNFQNFIAPHSPSDNSLF